METHYKTFDYGEENKIEYTEIFGRYTQIMEQFIVDQLNQTMNGRFDMDAFSKELMHVYNRLSINICF